MANTLEHEILKLVASESTAVWAFLCHERRAITFCSRAFDSLFEDPRLEEQDAVLPRKRFLTLPSIPQESVAEFSKDPVPDRNQFEELLLGKQYELISEQWSPEYRLQFHSLGDQRRQDSGILLLMESQFQVQLTSTQALRAHQASQQIAALSPRESQVMSMVVAGMTNQAIAIKLGLSPKTIEKHRKKMMTRLRVQSVAEAARIAFDAELFELLLVAQHNNRHASGVGCVPRAASDL